MNLTARRQEVLDYNLKAEKTRGSGWHPGDPGAEARDRVGELPLSERPIALHEDDTVYFVGPDAQRVKDSLQAFLTLLEGKSNKAFEKGKSPPDLIGHGERWQQQAVNYSKKILAQADELSLSTQGYNYVNSILAIGGIQVVSATAGIDN